MVAYSYLLWPPEGGHMAHVENHWLKAWKLSVSIYWKTRLDWTENDLCCIRRMGGKPICQPCGPIPVHQNQSQKLRALVLKWVSCSERSQSQIYRFIDLSTALHTCIFLYVGARTQMACLLLSLSNCTGPEWTDQNHLLIYCTNVFLSNVYHRCLHAPHAYALMSPLLFICGT